MYALGDVESKFASIIWEREPILSSDLVRICEKELEWKKSTTYTVLKKLCEKGIFQNKDTVVTSLLSEEEYKQKRSINYIEKYYAGSLPDFLVSFSKGRTLSHEEVESLRRFIEEYEE